ncbi:MAG: hypothetical protein ACM3UU_04390 [Ignavibacteriales bacterium]
MRKKVIFFISCIAALAIFMYWLLSTKGLSPSIPFNNAITLLSFCLIAFIVLIGWIIFFEEIQEWKNRRKSQN